MKTIVKYLFILAILGINNLCFANMGSPYLQGTNLSTAFSSKDIEIRKELIYITIDQDFQKAKYIVDYFVYTETEGNQIPLMFVAIDYSDNFKIWVDGVVVALKSVPKEYVHIAQSPFSNFAGSFQKPTNEADPEFVTVKWGENSNSTYNFNDLKYFEVNLSKGEHKIRVEYEATPYVDRHDWVKDYSYIYSLSPASFWKSFGTLEVSLKIIGNNPNVYTNIGVPTQDTDTAKVWKFSKLPAEYISINFKPQISSFAKTLIKISPFYLTLVFGMILMVLHFYWIVSFRKKNPEAKRSWVVIAGSIIVPLVSLLFFIFSFGWIDSLIGDAASQFHGYTFMVILFYPVLLAVYWLIAWLIDKMTKKI